MTDRKATKTQEAAAAAAAAAAAVGEYDSLIREKSQGIQTVSLLTGLYGSRGERIRHEAHVGALQLPAQVLPLLLPTTTTTGTATNTSSSSSLPTTTTTTTTTTSSGRSTKKKKKAQPFELPALDSLQRPSKMVKTTTTPNQKNDFIVTKVYTVPEEITKNDPITGDVIETIQTTRTCATNEGLPVVVEEDENEEAAKTAAAKEEATTSPTEDSKAVTQTKSGQTASAGEPERIRGGAGEEDTAAGDGSGNTDGGGTNANNSNHANDDPQQQQQQQPQPNAAGLGVPNPVAASSPGLVYKTQNNTSSSSTNHSPPPTGGMPPPPSNFPTPPSFPQPSRKLAPATNTAPAVVASPVAPAASTQPSANTATHAPAAAPSAPSVAPVANQHTQQLQSSTVPKTATGVPNPILNVASPPAPSPATANPLASPTVQTAAATSTTTTAPAAPTPSSAPAAAAAAAPTPIATNSTAATTTAPQAQKEGTDSGAPPLASSSSSTTLTSAAAKHPAAATSVPSAATPTATTPTSADAATSTPPVRKELEHVVVKGLEKPPAGQWEQHKPGPADEMTVDPATKTPKPTWYQADEISDFERVCLPEWFDDSARHRTVESYLQARNQMIKMSDDMGTKCVTATLVRRSIPGDAGSLLRLHEFLTAHALINEDVTNDSAPTSQVLLGGETATAPLYWNDAKDEKLMELVVEQARKKPRLSEDSGMPDLDWDAVAKEVGMTASQCEQRFLTLPVQTTPLPAGSITPDVSEKDGKEKDEKSAAVTRTISTAEMVHNLAQGASPTVVHSVVEAAMSHTNSLEEAQKAALAGLGLHESVQEAQSAQDALARVVSQVVEARMEKLEHRLALLDDVEGLLEAERVALELERRDLYTARCRHWFGGV